MLKISVVIPAYNEQKTVATVLERVRAQRVDDVAFEIIVIDDGSTDGTFALLEKRPELYDRLIHKDNGGKGSAVRVGLTAATGDYILFQDADLEYDPADYAKLIKPIVQFQADIVMGSRFVAPEYTRVYYFWHKIGNRLITLIFNIFNNTTFTDVYSCYLVYRRQLIDPATLISDGWDQHAEILSRAVRGSQSIYEVPISYHGRTYAEGKKIRAVHALGVIWTILKRRLFG